MSAYMTRRAAGDRIQPATLRSGISKILNRRSLMSVIATLLIATPGLANAQTASDWRMHLGEGPQTLPAKVDREGAWQKAFDLAVIPPKDDAGWTSAPDPKTIRFGSNSASKLGKDRCDLDVDYTYFETMVNIPAGTTINDFKIHFKGMDDASRITVFRPGDTVGKIVADSYVRRGADVRTANLKELVGEGENRVVITQLDWCPGGNLLESARVELNGVALEEDTRPFKPASHGDVHVYTPDGLKFDFQATGDFILLQSTDGELVIQARQEAWEQNPQVSVNRAAALNVAGVRVEYYARPTAKLFIDGVDTAMPTETLKLSNGGRIALDPGFRGGQRYLIYWPNGFTARLTHRTNDTMDIEVRKEISNIYVVAGLIGNMDGKSANDFQTRGGEILPFSKNAADIDKMGESWRVPASESLFVKGGRPSSETPVGDAPLTLATLDPATREASRAKCAAAGIADVTALSNCTYDVTVTGDETFIASAQAVEVAVASIPKAERVADETIEDMKPASAPADAPAAAPAVESLVAPGQPLAQGEKYAQNGHHLIYQADGNLCVYTDAARWIWCINNDPAVNYAAAANGGSTSFGEDGRLVVTGADGTTVWQAPSAGAQPGSKLTITAEGVLQIVAPNGDILWSSKAQ